MAAISHADAASKKMLPIISKATAFFEALVFFTLTVFILTYAGSSALLHYI